MLKNISNLGRALSKPEQKKINGGGPPPPPGLICSTYGEQCDSKSGKICCQSRGGVWHCELPSVCLHL